MSPARARATVPGLALTAGVGAVALVLAALETRLLGQPVIEALVLAIVIGMVVRSTVGVPVNAEPGVDFAARPVLEVAIVLLGASVDLPLLVRAGPALAVGIVLVVVLALALGYAIGRACGLSHPLAVLVAAGNAICGNSAIAALAPVIGAEREDVASAIAFTAVLGVVVVIGLPSLMGPLGLSDYQYGVLAGLSVYAVPQVLAAAFPVSAVAGQVGTLVKLVRVLMLGPVVLFFAVRTRAGVRRDARARAITLAGALPWFIVGFLLLAALRSAGVVPPAAAGALKTVSGWLTILAMAALGLGVDVRSLRRVGPRVVLAVTASLAVLVALAAGLVLALG